MRQTTEPPALDAGAARALAIVDGWAMARFGEGAIQEVRAQQQRQIELAADPEPVARVEDMAIERPDGSGLTLRLYRPSDAQRLPLLLFMHGGGWAVGTIENTDALCRSLANAAGALVASVEYRLAPEHPFPAGLDDCALAARWLVERADELGADADSLVLGGDSAGGNLAAALALRLRDEPRGVRLAGQLLLYPALDPTCSSPSVERNGSGAYGGTPDNLRSAWDLYVTDRRELEEPLVAPLRAARFDGLPPALIVLPQLDMLIDEGERYGELLRAAGVPTTVRVYDGQIHGFLTWSRWCARWREGVDDVGAWLRAVPWAGRG